jgi:DNA-binding transcriptional ArsR family regulator
MKEHLGAVKTFLIKDLETLRVFADPLRSQIFELLVQDALTVKQVADRLGLAVSKLYYHVNLLEKHGLILVAEARQHANLIEKVYRAAASELDIDPSLISFSTPSGQEHLYALITTTIDTTREDALRSFQARAFQLEQGAEEDPRTALFNRTLSRLTRERAQAFTERLSALVAEFDQGEVGPDFRRRCHHLRAHNCILPELLLRYGGRGAERQLKHPTGV